MKLSTTKSNLVQELIKNCRKGKSKAQKELYERYASKMLGVTLRYIKDVSEAEEVMIKGFMVVFSKIGQYSGEGSFEGWIRRIMVNESLMYLRKNRSMYLEVDIDEANYSVDYQTCDQNLLADDLLALINSLPMGYRTIFNLYAIEGYAHKDIADMLNISENTSKSQLSRARVLLQKKLEEENKRILEKRHQQ